MDDVARAFTEKSVPRRLDLMSLVNITTLPTDIHVVKSFVREVHIRARESLKRAKQEEEEVVGDEVEGIVKDTRLYMEDADRLYLSGIKCLEQFRGNNICIVDKQLSDLYIARFDLLASMQGDYNKVLARVVIC